MEWHVISLFRPEPHSRRRTESGQFGAGTWRRREPRALPAEGDAGTAHPTGADAGGEAAAAGQVQPGRATRQGDAAAARRKRRHRPPAPGRGDLRTANAIR